MTVPGERNSLFNEDQTLRILISKAPGAQDVSGQGLAELVNLMRDNGVAYTDISYKVMGHYSTYELRGTKQFLHSEIQKLGPTYAAQTLDLALFGVMDKLHFCQCHEPEPILGVIDSTFDNHESSVMAL